jgi:hypothetical protein
LVLGSRRGSVSPFLAVSNMRTAAARVASAMTPLVLTGISSTLLFSGATREHATTEQERERITADLVLQSDGSWEQEDNRDAHAQPVHEGRRQLAGRSRADDRAG